MSTIINCHSTKSQCYKLNKFRRINMKKILKIIITSLLLLPNILTAQNYGKQDIAQFCSDKKLPSPGKQYNGRYANNLVLKLVAGKYSYPNGGALLLFADNSYLLKIPSNRKKIVGTSGSDFMGGKVLGGCSKEQLSEALRANSLKSTFLKLRKKYR